MVNPDLLVRRLTVVVGNVVPEASLHEQPRQLSLFDDAAAVRQEEQAAADALERERRLQQVQVQLRERFGNNAILKGLNFEQGATAKQRNQQIGGHKA